MSSKAGWIIAAIILIAVGGFLVKTLLFPTATPPSAATLTKGFMDVITPASSITTVLKTLPDKSGNAGDNYYEAVKVFEKDRDLITDTMEELSDGTAVGLALSFPQKMYEAIAAGSMKKDLRYVLVHAPKVLPVDANLDAADSLFHTANAVNHLGMYYIKKGQVPQAQKLYEDLLRMGWHLVQAREHVQMVLVGFQVQEMALQGLKRALDPQKDQTRIAAIDKYLADVEAAMSLYKKKLYEVVWKLHDGRFHPGDAFNVLQNDKDRAWRVQAALVMGGVRYTATKSGDVRYCKLLLQKYSKDEDPILAAAAKASLELSLTDFRRIGN